MVRELIANLSPDNGDLSLYINSPKYNTFFVFNNTGLPKHLGCHERKSFWPVDIT